MLPTLADDNDGKTILVASGLDWDKLQMQIQIPVHRITTHRTAQHYDNNHSAS